MCMGGGGGGTSSKYMVHVYVEMGGGGVSVCEKWGVRYVRNLE